MKNFFNKMLSKLLAIIVIILFIVIFREQILTDSDISSVFSALMSALPFAKQISDIICGVMKYQYTIPVITPSSIISDFLKLAIMASIQPLVVGFLSMIFLKVPAGTYYERDEYMDGLDYRCKELIVTIFSAPFIALAAAYITTYISNYLTMNFGKLLSQILGIVSIIIMSLISIIPLIIRGLGVGTAILWRVVVTLLGKMATTMGTNAFCLWIFLSIVGGFRSQTSIAIFFLIVWLIIMDSFMQFIRRVIVS